MTKGYDTTLLKVRPAFTNSRLHTSSAGNQEASTRRVFWWSCGSQPSRPRNRVSPQKNIVVKYQVLSKHNIIRSYFVQKSLGPTRTGQSNATARNTGWRIRHAIILLSFTSAPPSPAIREKREHLVSNLSSSTFPSKSYEKQKPAKRWSKSTFCTNSTQKYQRLTWPTYPSTALPSCGTSKLDNKVKIPQRRDSALPITQNIYVSVQQYRVVRAPHVPDKRSKVASSLMNPKFEPWPLLQQAVALPPPYVHRLGRDAAGERRETLAAETVPHGSD